MTSRCKILAQGSLCAILGMGLASSAAFAASDIEFNGFGSIIGTKSFGNTIQQNTSALNDFEFTNYSEFGLNVRGQINKNYFAAAQLLSTGLNIPPGGSTPDFKPSFNWAFVGANYGDATLKAGRQLLPAFIYSEFVDAGAKTPFITAPGVYALVPVNYFEGVSAQYTADVGPGSVSAKVYYGNTSLTNTQNTSQAVDTVPRIGGIAVTGDFGDLLVHASVFHAYVQAAITTTVAIPALGLSSGASLGSYQANEDTWSFGARYTGHHVLALAEIGRLQSADGTPMVTIPSVGFVNCNARFLQNAEDAYFLLGYEYMGFTPYIQVDWSNNNSGVSAGIGRTQAIGVNYKLAKGVVAKAAYSIYNSEPGNPVFGAASNPGIVKSNDGSSPPDEAAKVLTLGLSVLF